MLEQYDPETEALIGKTVREIMSFSDKWMNGRPWHPFNLGVLDLSLDLRLCLINTRNVEADQFLFAKHLIVRGEPHTIVQAGQVGIRHSVLVEHVDSIGNSFNSSEGPVYVDIPLFELGIEPNPTDENLYDRYAYTLRYSDVSESQILGLTA